jgi:hypothetical protein
MRGPLLPRQRTWIARESFRLMPTGANRGGLLAMNEFAKNFASQVKEKGLHRYFARSGIRYPSPISGVKVFLRF